MWSAAVDLAEEVYRVSEFFPNSELYGLTAQMRRSSVSVASNIAEGYGRENRGSFIQFLRIAQGSLKELETQAEIARRVGLLKAEGAETIFSACEETGKMLRALIRSVQRMQADGGQVE